MLNILLCGRLNLVFCFQILAGTRMVVVYLPALGKGMNLNRTRGVHCHYHCTAFYFIATSNFQSMTRFVLYCRFGFGLMNAENYVTAAESWIPLPKQKICQTVFPHFVERYP